VLAWLHNVDDADLHLASVTLGEIQAGIKLTREQDPAAKFSMGGLAFRCWALLMHPQSDTQHEDSMIAAIAKVRQLTVVPRNVADFTRFDVPILNLFACSR
jgi:predicted nucleic acid-binding protein